MTTKNDKAPPTGDTKGGEQKAEPKGGEQKAEGRKSLKVSSITGRGFWRCELQFHAKARVLSEAEMAKLGDEGVKRLKAEPKLNVTEVTVMPDGSVHSVERAES